MSTLEEDLIKKIATIGHTALPEHSKATNWLVHWPSNLYFYLLLIFFLLFIFYLLWYSHQLKYVYTKRKEKKRKKKVYMWSFTTINSIECLIFSIYHQQLNSEKLIVKRMKIKKIYNIYINVSRFNGNKKNMWRHYCKFVKFNGVNIVVKLW